MIEDLVRLAVLLMNRQYLFEPVTAFYFIIEALPVPELIALILCCMLSEEEKYHLKNSLFTACKTGDVDTLRNLLAVLSQNVPTLESPEKKADSIVLKNQDIYLQNQNDIDNTCIKQSEESDKIPQDVNFKSKEEILSDELSSISSTVPETEVLLSDNLVQKDALQKSQGKTSSRPGSFKSDELLSPVDTNDMLNEPIGDNKYSLLHIAAKEGHRKVIRLLMECGANPATRYLMVIIIKREFTFTYMYLCPMQ